MSGNWQTIFLCINLSALMLKKCHFNFPSCRSKIINVGEIFIRKKASVIKTLYFLSSWPITFSHGTVLMMMWKTEEGRRGKKLKNQSKSHYQSEQKILLTWKFGSLWTKTQRETSRRVKGILISKIVSLSLIHSKLIEKSRKPSTCECHAIPSISFFSLSLSLFSPLN